MGRLNQTISRCGEKAAEKAEIAAIEYLWYRDNTLNAIMISITALRLISGLVLVLVS